MASPLHTHFELQRMLGQYTMGQLASPAGANGLPAAAAYDARKMYKDVPYFLDLPDPIRSLYEKLYFGRVDTFQNGIMTKCNTAGLKQISTSGQSVFALDFVADAFDDLKTHIQRVADHGLINSDSFYYQLNPLNGLERMQNRFGKIHQLWYEVLNTQINSNSSTKARVTNFESFVSALLNFMKRGLLDLPLTMTGIVVSNTSSPMISGLSLELAQENYSADQNKVRNFIFDNNFRYFVRAARKYGFYVDRNGPWKITADPFSGPMLEYMAAYGVTEDTFFSTYYDRTYSLDYEYLQTTLLKLYNQFVEDNPRVILQQATSPSPSCLNALVEQTVYRKRVDAQDLQALGEIYWLDLYFKLRAQETGVKFTDYDERFRTMTDVYRSVGLDKAVRYINNEIKPYLYNLQINTLPLTEAHEPVRIGTVSDRPTVVVGASDGGSSY
tara:strand:+ start:1057 stop:2382 length:1326 start_codon:yes stop_codon:yes gene_type:complete